MRQFVRVLDAPVVGATAFVPSPAKYATAATNGQNIVIGSPGSVAEYSPRPAATNVGAWGGAWQPSSVAPPVIFPSIYLAMINPSMKFPGYTGRNTIASVPATRLGAIVRNLFTRPRIGGQTTTPVVRPFTQWPTYGG